MVSYFRRTTICIKFLKSGEMKKNSKDCAFKPGISEVGTRSGVEDVVRLIAARGLQEARGLQVGPWGLHVAWGLQKRYRAVYGAEVVELHLLELRALLSGVVLGYGLRHLHCLSGIY